LKESKNENGFFSVLLSPVRGALEELGSVLVLFFKVVIWTFRPPFRTSEFLRQLDFVGSQSIVLIVFTGAFTGMVSALQTYNGMHRYGAESMVSAAVVLGLARELGPVLTALMVIGRVGSAMTAELGSMRNSQQIDALSSMAVEPIQYLIVPRILASVMVLPILALIFSFSGMVGAYYISLMHLSIDRGTFMEGIKHWLMLQDVVHGMLKALVFGGVISLIACYKGFYATGGARGVGLATTKAVVASSVLILVFDYLMTAMMLRVD
jgi:phospholipid/cholesterol/gamma-HCH transport system permease protein